MPLIDREIHKKIENFKYAYATSRGVLYVGCTCWMNINVNVVNRNLFRLSSSIHAIFVQYNCERSVVSLKFAGQRIVS